MGRAGERWAGGVEGKGKANGDGLNSHRLRQNGCVCVHGCTCKKNGWVQVVVRKCGSGQVPFSHLGHLLQPLNGAVADHGRDVVRGCVAGGVQLACPQSK